MSGLTKILIARLAFSGWICAAGTVNAAQLSIVEACTRTVNDYAWYLDHPGTDVAQTAQQFADLFTDDGVLTAPDDEPAERSYAGRKAIVERYLDNRMHARFLHVTSSIRVTPTSDTTATGTSYVSFYTHAVGGSMKDEGALKGVMENRDEYRIVEQRCKIFRRKSTFRLLNLFGTIELPNSE